MKEKQSKRKECYLAKTETKTKVVVLAQAGECSSLPCSFQSLLPMLWCFFCYGFSPLFSLFCRLPYFLFFSHTKEYSQGKKIYNSGIYVKRSICNEFEVDYYEKLEDVIELQYHNEHNRVFLFKCYWYDTIDIGIGVDLHHGLVKTNTNIRLRNVDDVFFLLSNANKCITHTLLPLERIVLGLISYSQ
jgi:hypothetical protein